MFKKTIINIHKLKIINKKFKKNLIIKLIQTINKEIFKFRINNVITINQ